MKVCVPNEGREGMDSEVSSHFGRSPNFLIYDTESEEIEVIDNYSEHMGGSKKPPVIMDEQGVDVMICSNLGRKAVSMFEDLGIEVYSGAEGSVRDAIGDWQEDKLDRASMSGACEGEH